MQILIVTPEAARWTAFGEGLRAAGLSCSFAGAPDDLKAESLKADRPLLVLWDEPYTGDALRAALDVTPCPLIPQFVSGTRGGVRALRVNHQLVMVRVFIQPGSHGEVGSPVQIITGNFSGRILC